MKYIITLTGPSGSGKTTLENTLIRNNIAMRLKGYTTRPIRAGERDGVDVNFVSYEEGKANHESSDTMQKLYFHGHYYGKTKEEIEALFKVTDAIVCVIEPSGLRQLESYALREDVTLLSYYVTAPTNVLITRMLKRFEAQENPDYEHYAKRMRNLIQEELKWDQRYNNFRESLINNTAEDLKNCTEHIQFELHRLRCAHL